MRSREFARVLSSGARLTFSHRNLFAAALPICAGGNAARVAAVKDLPIWCHMGTQDEIVPITAIDGLMEALRKVQPNVGYSRYPLFPHQIWSGVYSDMRVWKWLISHKQGGAKL